MKKVNYIVKYGLSTGGFTEKLIKRRNLKTIILLVENNKEFYFLIKAKVKEKGNLLIVYGSVVNIEQYIRENDITYIHYVISCLLFASLRKREDRNVSPAYVFSCLIREKIWRNTMESKILIVDDDKEIRNLISVYLENEGLKTQKAEDAMEALQLLEEKEFDLIILDIMMPNMDGMEACMKIRENRNIPIIMLSAKSEDIDKIQGLASGADDYLSKPFNPLELIARVKSQLRRFKKYNTSIEHNKSILEIGDLTVNTDTRQVWVRGKETRLTPKEFAILELLARNKGIVLSVAKIYEAVWKEVFYKSDNTVMVHITKIRDKIEEDSKHPIYIKTVWGIGYKI